MGDQRLDVALWRRNALECVGPLGLVLDYASFDRFAYLPLRARDLTGSPAAAVTIEPGCVGSADLRVGTTGALRVVPLGSDERVLVLVQLTGLSVTDEIDAASVRCWAAQHGHVALVASSDYNSGIVAQFGLEPIFREYERCGVLSIDVERLHATWTFTCGSSRPFDLTVHLGADAKASPAAQFQCAVDLLRDWSAQRETSQAEGEVPGVQLAGSIGVSGPVDLSVARLDGGPLTDRDQRMAWTSFVRWLAEAEEH